MLRSQKRSSICCTRPAVQVLPGPADDMAAFAAKSLAALPAYPPGMGPTIMSGTMTILPPPGGETHAPSCTALLTYAM